jgi:hypothetical protein
VFTSILEIIRKSSLLLALGTGSASMYATKIDLDGIELSTDSIWVGSDLTFRYGFVAGEDEMTKAGTYTVQIQYFPPGDAGIQNLDNRSIGFGGPISQTADTDWDIANKQLASIFVGVNSAT